MSVRICFYAPFKPLSHPHPSGDRTIGTGLYNHLQQAGFHLMVASEFRTRWLYWRPWRWPAVVRTYRQCLRRCRRWRPYLWLTYHTYYKAPDILGPAAASKLQIPYVIFQGIYSSKRRRDWRTLAGYLLNRRALLRAAHVFSNRREDFRNLARLIPPGRLTYVSPGIKVEDFNFSPEWRRIMRAEWEVDHTPVIVTAAMLRPGVKTQGVQLVMESARRLLSQGIDLLLVIVGAGPEEARLRQLAAHLLPERTRFAGIVAPAQMHRIYSAGDVFVFPGIRESLGMVYLEAQACGLPVVAFADGGVPEVVAAGESGLLVPPYDRDRFAAAIANLLRDPGFRRRMGRAAASYVRRRHDLRHNYASVTRVLTDLAAARVSSAPHDWQSNAEAV